MGRRNTHQISHNPTSYDSRCRYGGGFDARLDAFTERFRRKDKTYSTIRSGYRPLAVQLSGIYEYHGRTQLTLDRARLHLEFVAGHLGSKQDSPFWRQSCLKEANEGLLSHTEFNLSSIKFMKSEQENALLRIQSQGIVISNLIAQRDMDTSIKVASDSRELAAASRKDSAAMRTIAVVTTVFLPGTFVAV